MRLSQCHVNALIAFDLRKSLWRKPIGLSDLLAMDAEELRRELKKPGRSQAALARFLGFQDGSYVSKMVSGTRDIKAREAEKIRAYLAGTTQGERSEETIANTPDLPRIVDRSGMPSVLEIPEYDVRFSAGPGYVVDEEEVQVRRMWPLPRWLIIDQLGLNPDTLMVVEIVGDSMYPTLNSGDFGLIDRSDTRIGLPGIFGVWDGDGLACKRLERIPGSSPPQVRIKSDNPLHGEYTVPADVVDVKGRLRWVMSRA